MWKAVLLNDRLSLAFLKLAIASGDVRLIEAETEAERDQLRSLRTSINRARAQDAALTYCLLADSLFLDRINRPIFKDLSDDPEELRCRDAVELASPRFSEIVRFTDSSNRFQHLLMEEQQAANLYASAEPVLWQRWSRMPGHPDRESIRFALDLVVRHPSIIKMRRFGDSQEFTASVHEGLREDGHLVTAEALQSFSSLVYVTLVKAGVATAQLAEAEARSAVLPLPGLTFGRKRLDSGGYEGLRSDDVVAAVTLFLKEIKRWPLVTTLDDAIRVREDRAFLEFRWLLRRWVAALRAQDQKAEAELRRELSDANRGLESVTKCRRTGRFFTYLSLPLSILEVLGAPGAGLPFAVAGFGLQAYGDWKARKHRWLVVGS